MTVTQTHVYELCQIPPDLRHAPSGRGCRVGRGRVNQTCQSLHAADLMALQTDGILQVLLAVVNVAQSPVLPVQVSPQERDARVGDVLDVWCGVIQFP